MVSSEQQGWTRPRYLTELAGAWACWDSIERCAQRAGAEVKTYRVRFVREGSVAMTSSIWTDACTPQGAQLSVLRGRQARCQSEVEITSVEVER